jgi:hypothetical protein
MAQTFSVYPERARHRPCSRTRRRSTDRVREDINEGRATYLEEREREAAMRCCGAVSLEPFGEAWAEAVAIAAAQGAHPAFRLLKRRQFVRPRE